MKKYKYLWTIMVITLIGFGTVRAETSSNLDVNRISRTVAYTLPVFHLNQLPLDIYISTNAFKQYLETLDPGKSYFLQSDIDEFNQQAFQLHKQLRKGDIHFATNAYTILLERMEDRLDFTEALLEKGFDTSIDETFTWDRSEIEWPNNQAEWDEIWRKRIKNEYICLLYTSPSPRDGLLTRMPSSA